MYLFFDIIKFILSWLIEIMKAILSWPVAIIIIVILIIVKFNDAIDYFIRNISSIKGFGVEIQKKIEKTGEEQVKRVEDKGNFFKELSVDWNEASMAYNSGKYELSAERWKEIYKKYKIEDRPFYMNWGSSLLNWAGTIEDKEKRDELSKEAIQKYLKAENFTRGIAAFNIACCYAILGDIENCKEWLNKAKETGRLLSWERASTDRDLKKYAGEGWFKQIWKNIHG